MELKGRVALVTGSTSFGMGRSIALTLAHRGADIVLNYGTNARPSPLIDEKNVPFARSEKEAAEEAKRVQKAIEDMGRRALLIEADTRDESQVAAMVKRAIKELGHIGILVNNAGGHWRPSDYTDIPVEHWKQVLSAEIDGAFLTMKHVVPGMRRRRWGRVIHIGMSGALVMEGVPGLAADYSLGKAVRAWMTRALGSQEYGRGITVNCIEPGIVHHITFEDALDYAQGGTTSAWAKRKKPNSHDTAEIAAFLCSEAGRFVSGNLIRIPWV